jgi:glycine/sarcosine N-methyltransferase
VGNRATDILDCACGIGTQALGLAALGHRVTGSDLSAVAIARAREEAGRRGLALTLRVADLRALDRLVPGAFGVVLAADNALPHLLSVDDLGQALRAIAAKLRPGGAFLASLRDYDGLGRPATWPGRCLTAPNHQRRFVQQVWEWLDERRYRVHIHIAREVADGWRSAHHVGLYRALPRAELAAGLQAAGLEEVRWLIPAETGYHQPIVLARKPGSRG